MLLLEVLSNIGANNSPQLLRHHELYSDRRLTPRDDRHSGAVREPHQFLALDHCMLGGLKTLQKLLNTFNFIGQCTLSFVAVFLSEAARQPSRASHLKNIDAISRPPLRTTPTKTDQTRCQESCHQGRENRESGDKLRSSVNISYTAPPSRRGDVSL
jgi:hypothetical protein